MKLLDLFCGRWGWSRAFAARGWECIGIDLVKPPETPNGCTFYHIDVLSINHIQRWMTGWDFDFVCASSPCEEFSVHGMKHFHPNPKYPELGIKLFNHTRKLCEDSGLPYVMENVRSAQKFVGNAVHHCGPFYLWGSGVPPLMPKGITKGIDLGNASEMKGMTKEEITQYRKKHYQVQTWSKSKERKEATAQAATIPIEIATCVADYAERICSTQQYVG